MKADTMTEWLDELNRLNKEQPRGFSTRELATAKGCGIERARDIIKRGMADGIIRLAGRRETLDMAGRSNHVPVYSLVKHGKKNM